MTTAIRKPALLFIEDQQSASTMFGCDQDWYHESWQRRAGCGPCTAATILFYLARSRHTLSRLYPNETGSRPDFTCFMADIWHYVTPGVKGVNEASMLVDGVLRYATGLDIKLLASTQKVPAKRQRTAPFTEWADFIRAGLDQDSPVAFLNLSNGRLPNLDSWHWVTITSLDDQGQAGISDSGTQKTIDLARWYASSWLGGAAVWFTDGTPAAVVSQPG